MLTNDVVFLYINWTWMFIAFCFIALYLKDLFEINKISRLSMNLVAFPSAVIFVIGMYQMFVSSIWQSYNLLILIQHITMIYPIISLSIIGFINNRKYHESK